MLVSDQFNAISFDCYGTLIDWETGILSALMPLLTAHGVEIDDESLLANYAGIESELEHEEYIGYRIVLTNVVMRMGTLYGFVPKPEEQGVLADSLPSWPSFPDTTEALRALKKKYRLAVISNTDDDLFAETARHLGVEFDHLITAAQVRAYKPSPKIFAEAYKRIGLPPNRILHVAQSLYHDIVPARSLGQSTVWINRRHGKSGFGATPEATVKPDLELPDLQSLVKLLGL
jgi:2-haloacid dehalogenase